MSGTPRASRSRRRRRLACASAGAITGPPYGPRPATDPRGERRERILDTREVRVTGPLTALAVGGGLYVLTVRGALALDLGIGRRTRPLGPLRMSIAAPRDVVFEVVAAPYRRTPRAMRDKLDVLERSDDLVLAAHHTPVAYGMTATTVETVRFEPPARIGFRLVRGPVPHVLETFELGVDGAGTELVYTGELGTDLWAAGARWGDVVARSWERTVAESLEGIRAEAERRAGTA